jgi:hypothetical protein
VTCLGFELGDSGSRVIREGRLWTYIIAGHGVLRWAYMIRNQDSFDDIMMRGEKHICFCPI